ncbi:hypothetical protein L9F63_013748, partial [Diploptera punctata]
QFQNNSYSILTYINDVTNNTGLQRFCSMRYFNTNKSSQISSFCISHTDFAQLYFQHKNESARLSLCLTEEAISCQHMGPILQLQYHQQYYKIKRQQSAPYQLIKIKLFATDTTFYWYNHCEQEFKKYFVMGESS